MFFISGNINLAHEFPEQAHLQGALSCEAVNTRAVHQGALSCEAVNTQAVHQGALSCEAVNTQTVHQGALSCEAVNTQAVHQGALSCEAVNTRAVHHWNTLGPHSLSPERGTGIMFHHNTTCWILYMQLQQTSWLFI